MQNKYQDIKQKQTPPNQSSITQAAITSMFLMKFFII